MSPFSLRLTYASVLVWVMSLALSGCNRNVIDNEPVPKREKQGPKDQVTSGVIHFFGATIEISGDDLVEAGLLYSQIQKAALVPATLDVDIDPGRVVILQDENGHTVKFLIFYPTENLVDLSGETFELRDRHAEKLFEFFRRMGRSDQDEGVHSKNSAE